MTITGRCLCGPFAWESSAPPVVTRVCWCRDCQYSVPAAERSTPASYSCVTVTARGPATIQVSRPVVTKCTGDSARSCGTPLISEAEARPHLIFRPRRHVRRSESRQSCVDDLDVVRAPLGLVTQGCRKW